MNTRAILLTLIIFLAGVSAVSADDNRFMGSWKLNLSKSKLPPTAVFRHSTATYAAVGEQIKVTVDENDANGRAFHMEWSGKFDGKDYLVNGNPNFDTWSYRKINDDVLLFTVKKNNNIVLTRRMKVSADGKTRTNTGTVMDAHGETFSISVVYEKQQ
jgi:hypothetical protein